MPEVVKYRTNNNQEVDFLIEQADNVSGLIQVIESLGEDRVRTREIDALTKAMGELKINKGLILTYDTEENIKLANKTITLKPIYKWLPGG